MRRNRLNFHGFVAAVWLSLGGVIGSGVTPALAFSPDDPIVYYRFGGGSSASRPARREPLPVHRPSRPAAPTDVVAEHAAIALPPDPGLARNGASGPMLALVSLNSQRLAIYDATGAVLHSRVSSGRPGHDTPTGVFSVIEKDRYHESNIYSGAPMPFMQRITWSGVALHAGYLPGYAASHGCIRLPEAIALQLFGATHLGMRVIVSPTELSVLPIEHAALPVPVMLPPQLDNGAERSASAAPIQLVALQPNDAIAAASVNPRQHALTERIRLRAAAVAAVVAAKAALAASQLASADAIRALADRRVARDALASAERQLAETRNAAANPAATAAERDAAATDVARAEALVTDRLRQQADAIAAEDERSQAAFQAADQWRAAEARISATAREARLGDKSVEPLSVFISRREGRLYVRQGFMPIFDAAVVIKGSHPLGTHVFTVMSADEATGRLSWTAVSVPDRAKPRADTVSLRREPAPDPVDAEVVSSATEALDRIELSDDVRQKLNERIWLGGSIVVSDRGLGSETGEGTDFVVLTK